MSVTTERSVETPEILHGLIVVSLANRRGVS